MLNSHTMCCQSSFVLNVWLYSAYVKQILMEDGIDDWLLHWLLSPPFPWWFLQQSVMFAYTANSTVSYLVLLAHVPHFHYHLRDTHAYTPLGCVESNTVTIINASISAWQITSLSEMPALHILSAKWHSLLQALIPHSEIRAHLLHNIFSRQFLISLSRSQARWKNLW